MAEYALGQRGRVGEQEIVMQLLSRRRERKGLTAILGPGAMGPSLVAGAGPDTTVAVPLGAATEAQPRIHFIR